MYIRRLIAVWSARLIKLACQLRGKQGATVTGKAALRIDPSILNVLAKEVREGIFIVCGTNGKSTTNTLLASLLEAEGHKIICNRTGSNMLDGIVSAFALGAGIGGHLDADYACLEIDEASAVKVLPYLKPDYMILTNLFLRDQVDRYGGIDNTMKLLSRAIKMAPEMKLLVNGDEPLCTYLAQQSPNAVFTYGVSRKANEPQSTDEAHETQICKGCGEKLVYRFYHYSQLGDYYCPKCGFKRPAIHFDAAQVDFSQGISFYIGDYYLKSHFRDFYSLYNMLAVCGAASLAGISIENLNQVLDNYTPPIGRNEYFQISDTKVILKLAKNQVGFDQNISAVLADPEPKDIIILIDDNSQDGIDLSWLWDVDFERLRKANAASITVSGIRRLDMCLRLKYAEITSDQQEDMEMAIRSKIENGTKNLYLLVNYSGLYSAHGILKKLEKQGAPIIRAFMPEAK